MLPPPLLFPGLGSAGTWEWSCRCKPGRRPRVQLHRPAGLPETDQEKHTGFCHSSAKLKWKLNAEKDALNVMSYLPRLQCPCSTRHDGSSDEQTGILELSQWNPVTGASSVYTMQDHPPIPTPPYPITITIIHPSPLMEPESLVLCAATQHQPILLFSLSTAFYVSKISFF